MTTAEIIDGILEREGGYVDRKHDRGGPTRYGITANTLGEWRKLGRPATRAEVKALTQEQARAIYGAMYVKPFDAIPFEALRNQLVDYGVLSGQGTAIRALQDVLGIPIDGVIGPRTNAALLASSWRMVNNALIARRLKHFTDDVAAHPEQLENFHGWCARAISFWISA